MSQLPLYSGPTNEVIQPLADWALVRLIKTEERRGALVLPRDEKKHPRLRAVLVAKGPKGEREQTAAEPGDMCILQRHNLVQGIWLHDDESGLVLIPQNEIIGVVEKAGT